MGYLKEKKTIRTIVRDRFAGTSDVHCADKRGQASVSTSTAGGRRLPRTDVKSHARSATCTHMGCNVSSMKLSTHGTALARITLQGERTKYWLARERTDAASSKRKRQRLLGFGSR